MVHIRSMPTTKPQQVPPYCKGEIPAILPLLLMQVKILYRLVSCIPVSAEEELVLPTCQTSTNPRGCAILPPVSPQCIFIPPHTSTLPPQVATPPVLQPCAKTPNPSSLYGKSMAKEKVKTVNFSEEKEGDEEDYSLLSEGFPIEDKIPKPWGEMKRPGRGGYNLEKQLNWNDEVLERFKVNTAYLPCRFEMKLCE